MTMGVVSETGAAFAMWLLGSLRGAGFVWDPEAKHRNTAFFVLFSHLATSTCGVQRLCLSVLETVDHFGPVQQASEKRDKQRHHGPHVGG